MNQSESMRCPACWSGFVAGTAVCTQCGERLAPASRRPGWLLPLALGVVALGGGAWWQWTRRAEPAPGAPASITLRQPEGEASDRRSPPRAAQPADSGRHTLAVRLEGVEHPVAAAVLQARATARTALFIPAALMPLDGPLRDVGGAVVDVAVITVVEARGFALLELLRPPDDLEALEARPLPVGPGARLRPVPDADAVLVLGRSADGLLALDRALPAGVVLIDGDGLAAAYAMGGDRALDIGPAASWLRSGPPAQPLEQVQRRLRAADPGLRLRDAIAALDQAGDSAGLRAVLADLDVGFGMARDPELIAAYDRTIVHAYTRLVGALVAEGASAAAEATLQAAMARFPGDHGFLLLAAETALANGNVQRALDCCVELADRDPARAEAAADRLVPHLTEVARQWLAGDAAQPAIDLLGRAVQVFPRRAELHSAYADALADGALGDGARIGFALDQARIAAALDPRHRSQVRLLEQIAARRPSREASGVEIPFDADTHVLQAECSIGGESLVLLIDSGASLTVVPARFASSGRATGRTVRVQTASGLTEGPLIRLAEITIAGLTVRSVSAIALDLPGSLAGKGLLGLNVLRRLNMRIDGERNRLVLGR